MTELIKKVKEFAINAHGNQKYGDQPYIVHLESVAEIVKPYGKSAQIIAWLHDVVEDTSVRKTEIEQEFGNFIAECVGVLTDEPGADRKEKKAKTYAKMAKTGQELNLALIVKAADRLSNIKACIAFKRYSKLEMYKNEHEAFKTAAYRPGLCDDLWEKMEAVFAK